MTGGGLCWTAYCTSIHSCLYVLPERMHTWSRTLLVKMHTFGRIKTKGVWSINIKRTSIFLTAPSADNKLKTYSLSIYLSVPVRDGYMVFFSNEGSVYFHTAAEYCIVVALGVCLFTRVRDWKGCKNYCKCCNRTNYSNIPLKNALLFVLKCMYS